MKKKVFFLVALFLFPALLQATIMDEYKKARDFKDIASKNNAEAMKNLIEYLGDQKPILRDGAFEAIRMNVTDGEAIKFLAKALSSHKNTAVREHIAELLGIIGKGQEEVVGKALIHSLGKDPSVDVRVEAARALGLIKYEPAAKELEKMYKNSSKHWLLKGECLDAMVEIKGLEGAKDILKKALKDSQDFVVQGYALKLIYKNDPKQGLEEAIAILSKVKPKQIKLKGWQPAYVAFQAVARAARENGVDLEKLKEAITTMIELLKELEGRLFYNDIEALERITGEQGMIPSYKDWKAWWDLNKKNFQPPKDEKKSGGEKKHVGTVIKYHGIPIYSHRIVFMVDHSGSMKNPLDGEGEQKGKIKFEVCKTELCNTIQALSKEVYFNIYFLETDVFSWKNRLQKISPEIQRESIHYVGNVSSTKAIGNSYKMRGNFFDGLYKAMQDPFGDTIFLLSDGGPTAGKYAFPVRVKKKITEYNKFLNFEIHTILIGASKEKDQEFMEELSKLNYGKAHVRAGKKFDSSSSSSSSSNKKKPKKKKDEKDGEDGN